MNRFGLRNNEISESKPDGVTRLAIVGGSSAFGYKVSNEETSSARLERRLRGSGHPVEVLNAGVPGYNLTQVREQVLRTVAPLDPDYVLVYAGWNEIPELISEEAWTESRRKQPAPPWWERALNHSTFYGFIAHRLLPGRQPQFTPPGARPAKPTAAGAAAFQRHLGELLDAIDQVGALSRSSVRS